SVTFILPGMTWRGQSRNCRAAGRLVLARSRDIEVVQRCARPIPGKTDEPSGHGECDVRRAQILAAKTDVRDVRVACDGHVADAGAVRRDDRDARIEKRCDAHVADTIHRHGVEKVEAADTGEPTAAARPWPWRLRDFA